MMFSMKTAVAALFLATASAEVSPAFLRQMHRELVGCNEACTVTGSCTGGTIQVCHEGNENECIASSEWNEHCTDHGDTCGACATSSTTGGGACFSATSTLFVQDKGWITMEEASVGDMVLTGSNNKFEPLFAFGHQDKDGSEMFYQIATHQDTLEVTAEHLVYLAGKAHPVRADSIQVGDSLVTATAESAVVKSIDTVVKQGLYAPLTPSGKLIVNGLQASSYIALQADDAEYFTTLHGLVQIPHDAYVHLYLTPMRVICLGITDAPCHVMNSQGMPLYIDWGIQWINASHNSAKALAQPLFALTSGALLAAFVVVEALFGATYGPLIVFAIATAYYSSKSKADKKKKVA